MQFINDSDDFDRIEIFTAKDDKYNNILKKLQNLNFLALFVQHS
jgi:hypothetical protein